MTTSTNPNKVPVPSAGTTAIFTRVIQSGPLVFLAGQTGNDPATGKLVPGGIVPETVQAFASIKETLAHAGLGIEDLVSVTIYVRDYPENIAALNEVSLEVGPVLTPSSTPPSSLLACPSRSVRPSASLRCRVTLRPSTRL